MVKSCPAFLKAEVTYVDAETHLQGAPGHFDIKITAVSAGEGDIVLSYSRPWSVAETDKKHTIHVTN